MKNGKRKTKTKKIKWIGLLLVSVLLVNLVTTPTSVMAVPSLPHIQAILKNGGTFHVLEIVPEENTGSLGYYVEGQEPCKNWQEELKTKKSTQQRTDDTNKMFSDLKTDGLIGTDKKTPLTFSYSENGKYYNEKKIWEFTGTPSKDWNKLVLDHEETVPVKGEIQRVKEGEDGKYAEKFTYHYQVGGSHIQKVDHFQYVTTKEEAERLYPTGYYFYQPTFQLLPNNLTDEELEQRKDTPLYLKDAGTGNYYYVGTPVSMGGIDGDIDYYYTQENPIPSQKHTTVVEGEGTVVTPYVAIGKNFEPAPTPEGGYFQPKLSGYQYVGEKGTHNFQPDETKGPVHLTDDTIYYQGGYTNNQWFLSKVFDLTEEEIADAKVSKPRMVVKSIPASQVTTELLERANLIHLSKGYVPNGNAPSYIDGENSLASELAVALYQEVAKGTPLVLDLGLLDSQGSLMKNLSKALLWDKLTPVAEDTAFAGLPNFGNEPPILEEDEDNGFILNHIFAIDFPFDTGSGTAKALATDAFDSKFAKDIYGDGFQPVMEEILSENALRSIDGTEKLPEEVTLGNSLRYIINSADQRQVLPPNELRVLEIEPAKAENPITEEYIKKQWLNNTDSECEITVTTMTVAEFVGKIEDINELYDIIYIGADKANLNQDGISNSVDGRAYNGIGDKVRVNLEMTGLLNRDYYENNPKYNSDGNPTAPINAMADSNANLTRFSGNDITEKKGKDLQNFALAGYPIVLADALVKEDSTNTEGNGIQVNSKEVDNSSNLYDALTKMMKKPNVMQSNNAKNVIGTYLKVSKPQILADKLPPIYNEENETEVLEQEGTMEFTFEIENNTDTTPKATTYDCNLFIDVNADGRFAENELLNDIEVAESDSGDALNPVEKDGKMRYALEEKTQYVVKRKMPEGMVGIIPWKLSIVKNGAEHIHASIQNFTRIPAKEEQKQEIKVLQIVQTDKDRLNIAESDTYQRLIEDLDDFKVQIETIDTNALSREGDANAIFEALNQYNMLVIGFNDMYDGISKNSAEAITRFIDSKKSVLFTHDTTSFYGLPYSNYPRVTGEKTGSVETIWKEVFKAKNKNWKPQNFSGISNFTAIDGEGGNHFTVTIDGRNILAAGKKIQIQTDEKLKAGTTYVLKAKIKLVEDGNIRFGVEGYNYIKLSKGEKTQEVSLEFKPDWGEEKGTIYLQNQDLFFENTCEVENVRIEEKEQVPILKPVTKNDIASGWGYYFNTVIRDVVGLDRYGVISKVPLEGGGTLRDVVRAGADATKAKEDAILAAGRGVAYKPNTARKETVSETQGFTNYTLKRFTNAKGLNNSSNDNGTAASTKVSQVNKGQITSYPFNINLGKDKKMEIMNTHDQYFQVNMNTDDIVVWYCLAGGSYDKMPNDVTNSYYIYNKGNVTYTGVGHFSEAVDGRQERSEGFQNEAKLFINTMIAAYQAGSQPPSLNIKDPSDLEYDMDMMYFMTDYADSSVLDSTSAETQGQREVYFKITDSTIAPDKKISLKFYYTGGENGVLEPWNPTEKVTEFTPDEVMFTDGQSAGELRANVVYKIRLPEEIFKTLNNPDLTGIQVFVRVESKIGTNEPLYGYDGVELRKMGLHYLE